MSRKRFLCTVSLAIVAVSALLVAAAVPTPISADKESDPETIVKYLATWEAHLRPFADGANKLSVQSIELEDWKSACVHGIVADGCVVLQDEIKLLVNAERLAACATTPDAKVKAGRVMHRIYANFKEHITEAARGNWSGSIGEIRKTLPDVADHLQQNLIAPLDRLDTEFIQPRTRYWLSQTK